MGKKENSPAAKLRIFEAAIKIFAEKSFEGSRIDEIAKEAGVPKSLIYYHFKSKNEILEVLFKNFMDEYVALIGIAKNDTHQSKAGELSSRRDYYKEFFIKNADLVRIIFIDSLKKSSSDPIIFKFVDAMITEEKEKYEISKKSDYDKNERLVAEFFTNIIPLFSFLCFHRSWVKYFNIDIKKLEEMFGKILGETHGAYHKNHD
jgi:AcrR family transcriptional regulator